MSLQSSHSASTGFFYSFWWGVIATVCALLLFCLAGMCVRRCCRGPARKRKENPANNREVSWLLPAEKSSETFPNAAAPHAPQHGGAKAAPSSARTAPPSTAQGGGAAAGASAKQLLPTTTAAAPTRPFKEREEPACVPPVYHPRRYGTAAPCSMTPVHRSEAAVPTAAPPPLPASDSLRCPSFTSDSLRGPSFTSDAVTADELEDGYTDAADAGSPWRVPPPTAPTMPAATSTRLPTPAATSWRAPRHRSPSRTRHGDVTVSAAAGAAQDSQEAVSLNAPAPPPRQASPTALTMPAKASGTPLTIAPARRSSCRGSDGGEAATAVHDVEACLHATRAELERAQRELLATLESTKCAREEQDRLTHGIADMERYRSSLDGIIAFTLRELEDAADGVEEAEEKLRRESAAAQRRVDAMQSRLLGGF